MVRSNEQESVISKMAQERTQLRQAIDVVRDALFTGKSCNLPKDMLDKLVKLGYI